MSSGRESIGPPLSHEVISAYLSRSLTSNGTSLPYRSLHRELNQVATLVGAGADHLGLVAQAHACSQQVVAQVAQIGAAQVRQLDTLEGGPDARVGMAIWRRPWPLLHL